MDVQFDCKIAVEPPRRANSTLPYTAFLGRSFVPVSTKANVTLHTPKEQVELPYMVLHTELVREVINRTKKPNFWLISCGGVRVSKIFDPTQKVLAPSATERGVYTFVNRGNVNPAHIVDRLSVISRFFYEEFGEDLPESFKLPEDRQYRICIIQALAAITLQGLVRNGKITMAESSLCTSVIQDITLPQIEVDTGRQKQTPELSTRTLDCFARELRERLFSTLSMCFPRAFTCIPQRGVDFGTVEVKMMGGERAKVELVRRKEIAMCPDRATRIQLNARTASALRDVLIQLRVRAANTWLFDEETPECFEDNPISTLLQYGFKSIGEEDPAPNDLVVYMDDQNHVLHFGIFAGRDMVSSKWEGLAPQVHAIDALPSPLKGTKVTFLRFDNREFEIKIGNLVQGAMLTLASTDKDQKKVLDQLMKNLNDAVQERITVEEIAGTPSPIYSQMYYIHIFEEIKKVISVISATNDRSLLIANLSIFLSEILTGKFFNQYFQSEEFAEILDGVHALPVEDP